MRPESCLACICNLNEWECKFCTSPKPSTLLATNLEDTSISNLTENTKLNKELKSLKSFSSSLIQEKTTKNTDLNKKLKALNIFKNPKLQENTNEDTDSLPTKENTDLNKISNILKNLNSLSEMPLQTNIRKTSNDLSYNLFSDFL